MKNIANKSVVHDLSPYLDETFENFKIIVRMVIDSKNTAWNEHVSMSDLFDEYFKEWERLWEGDNITCANCGFTASADWWQNYDDDCWYKSVHGGINNENQS